MQTVGIDLVCFISFAFSYLDPIKVLGVSVFSSQLSLSCLGIYISLHVFWTIWRVALTSYLLRYFPLIRVDFTVGWTRGTHSLFGGLFFWIYADFRISEMSDGTISTGFKGLLPCSYC